MYCSSKHQLFVKAVHHLTTILRRRIPSIFSHPDFSVQRTYWKTRISHMCRKSLSITHSSCRLLICVLWKLRGLWFLRWAWGRVLGEAAEWCPADVAAASSCSVSLWRSFNPDVLHGAAKCMRLILASACQSTELLLLGCELRRDMQCWGWKAAASHRVWQDHTDRLAASDSEPWSAAAYCWAWRASSAGWCKSSAYFPVSHPFTRSLFAVMVSTPTTVSQDSVPFSHFSRGLPTPAPLPGPTSFIQPIKLSLPLLVAAVPLRTWPESPLC